jgi:hypothetical protein
MHLTEDEFVSFVLEDLPEELEQEVDGHIERCISCAQQLEDFYTAQEQFPAEEWAAQRNAFVAGLRQRVFGTRTLLISWPDVAFGIAAQAPTVEDGQVETEHGTLRWRKVKDQVGNLTVRFGSHAMELEGRRLRLTAGNLQREVVLGRVAPNQVGVEIFITRDERAQLPEDVALSVELIREDSEASSTG